LKKAASILILVAFTSIAMAQDRDLLSVVDELGGVLEWNPLREVGVISLGQDRIVLQVGTPFGVVNYREKVPIDPPSRVQGAVMLTESAVEALRAAVEQERLARALEQLRIGYVLIDPGHGGKDSGAVGEYQKGGKTVPVKEKDTVLAIAQDLSQMLRAAYPDKEIRHTRTDDTYVSLEDRAETANALLQKTKDAVLYISIHANATLNKLSRPTGFEVWYLPPEYRRTLLDPRSAGGEASEMLPILNSVLEEEISVESIVLAREILKGLDGKIGSLSPDRGLKEESWYVVRNAKMPAVLIEVGFISTPEEAARLASETYLKQVAEGIYDGIHSFISRFEGNESVGSR